MNSHCSEHDYEPIALPHPAMAPVVRITDTDVMPVADSDDSIDDRGRLPPDLMLDGDVILPLDGKIEDSAMEGRELGETGGDTSEELEPTAQQFQDRLEERFLAPTPYTESRTDGEVNTSQVESTVWPDKYSKRRREKDLVAAGKFVWSAKTFMKRSLQTGLKLNQYDESNEIYFRNVETFLNW